MLNFDALGSGKPAVVTSGSKELTDWAVNTYAQQNSLNVRFWGPEGTLNDHYYFIDNLEVPAIMFLGDDLSVIDSSLDVIDLVDSSIMGTHMAIALEMIKQAPSVASSATSSLSTDATLSGLELSSVGFSTFDSETTSYTASVANSVTETTVTPTLNHSGASYVTKLNGVTDSDGTISLAVGSNIITVVVTAEDDSTTKTYTVTVTRDAPPSNDATLSNLTLIRIDFGTFGPETTSYTASVANSVTETTVTPISNHAGATYVIKLNDVTDSDGIIPLAVGSNVITVVVTAEDDTTTKTYTVTVTRTLPAPDRDATLSNLTLSGVDIGTFDPATTSYFVKVPNRVSQTTVSPTLNDSDATYVIKRNGVTDPDGTVSLATGRNHIMVKVTADDDETVKLYHVTVFRSPAPAADMGELPTDNPAVNFRPTRKSHDHVVVAWSVPNGRGITELEQQRFYHDGTEYVVSGVDGPYTDVSTGGSEYTVNSAYADPDTLYKFVLTLKNASDTAVIVSSFTVRTLPAPDRDATLSNLTLSGVDIGTFDPATTSYFVKVPNRVSQTTVSPTLNDSDATYVIKRNGVTDPDGTVSLATGRNHIMVKVTADDDETVKLYHVTVFRSPAPAADMGELPTDNPAVNFRATRKSHNHVSVAWSVPNGRSITKHELQRFYHDGTEYVASGVDGPYTAASAGGNEYTVSSVNADPDTLYKFVLTLKNASDTAVIVSSFTVRTLPVPDRDATLSNLTLSNVDFGTFTSGTTSYAASVANSVTQTTVTPTLNDSDATYVIKRNGVTDSDGTISLAVGQNIITVVVTADDNSTTNSYTVIVNRTELAMLSKYDTNGDGQINKAEVMTAIGDYLFGAGQITKAEVIEIIDAYLFG